MMLKWLALRDSNPRLADYEPAVLTAELRAGEFRGHVGRGHALARGACWHGDMGTRGRSVSAKVQSGAELLCKSAKVGYESMEFRVSSIGAHGVVTWARGWGGRPARPRMTGPVIPTLWAGKWSSEGESNPHRPVRSRAFCPLNYLTLKMVRRAGFEPA